MILVLGGTTEGRAVAKVLDEAVTGWYYSTKSSLQEVHLVHGIRLSGAMNVEGMTNFCKTKEIHLIIDAAHPFATLLHKTVEEVATDLDIPVIRYERKFPPRDKRFVWCKDFSEAIVLLREGGMGNLLALTGVNTIASLRPFWEEHSCWFRILDREESRAIVARERFPSDKIIYYKAEKKNIEVEEEKELIRQLAPDAILTKESGFTGNFEAKAEAALQMNVPLFVVQRPTISSSFYIVNGEAGLRRQLDRLLPGFFPLRTGFTTGTCATVAAKAALLALLTGKEQKESQITLPSGETISLPVESTEITPDYARCIVIKDAGDDPDVTNKSEIIATVSLSSNYQLLYASLSERCLSIISRRSALANCQFISIPLDEKRNLILCGGEGVGTVTLPGLGLEVGGPAINMTPRRMIAQEIREILGIFDLQKAKDVTVIIAVSNGEEIAKRTFNPKLGIIGGISIIGTSGIVRPFSHEAFVASIRKEMEVAKAIGCKHVVINSGARSERFLKARYTELPPQAFIHYGNYIGETLRIASELEIPCITLGIMIGKAVKLAEGHLDTHSRKVVMNKEFLKKLAAETGCSTENIEKINSITLARELWQLFPKDKDSSFYRTLISKCYSQCRYLYTTGELQICLMDEEGYSVLFTKD